MPEDQGMMKRELQDSGVATSSSDASTDGESDRPNTSRHQGRESRQRARSSSSENQDYYKQGARPKRTQKHGKGIAASAPGGWKARGFEDDSRPGEHEKHKADTKVAKKVHHSRNPKKENPRPGPNQQGPEPGPSRPGHNQPGLNPGPNQPGPSQPVPNHPGLNQPGPSHEISMHAIADVVNRATAKPCQPSDTAASRNSLHNEENLLSSFQDQGDSGYSGTQPSVVYNNYFSYMQNSTVVNKNEAPHYELIEHYETDRFPEALYELMRPLDLGDWKMLASHLQLDRFIDSIQTEVKNHGKSPTRLLLDELRKSKGKKANIAGIKAALQKMKRIDVLDELVAAEKEWEEENNE